MAEFGFHPLKAGRRLPTPIFVSKPTTSFPSPQGGSETEVIRMTREKLEKVSIPSRRVGDCPIGAGKRSRKRFPSPQGGSETVGINQ